MTPAHRTPVLLHDLRAHLRGERDLWAWETHSLLCEVVEARIRSLVAEYGACGVEGCDLWTSHAAESLWRESTWPAHGSIDDALEGRL